MNSQDVLPDPSGRVSSLPFGSASASRDLKMISAVAATMLVATALVVMMSSTSTTLQPDFAANTRLDEFGFDAVAAPPSFCWLNTSTRTAGSMPTECAADQTNGLFCYKKCAKGLKPINDMGLCRGACPPGWDKIAGIACGPQAYANHPYSIFSKAQCEREEARERGPDHVGPVLPCYQGTGIAAGFVYPQCQTGFKKSWSGMQCNADPSLNNQVCKQLSMGIDTGFDECYRNYHLMAPVCKTCKAGLEGGHCGLCYPKCPPNSHGIGPVCWGMPPEGWIRCGLGAATSHAECKKVMEAQVLAVFQTVAELALMIATDDVGNAAEIGMDETTMAAEDTAEDTGRGAEGNVLDGADDFKKAEQMEKINDKIADAAKKTEDVIAMLSNPRDFVIENGVEKFIGDDKDIDMTEEQAKKYIGYLKKGNAVLQDMMASMKSQKPYSLVRDQASMVAAFDPSGLGISGDIAAFTYPKCTDVLPTRGLMLF